MSVWSWGANSHGQLGLERTSEQERPGAVCAAGVEAGGWKGVTEAACGGAHSLLVDEDGRLFACGWNAKLQLGSDSLPSDVSSFRRIWNLSGITFTHVACGWNFSCAVTDDRFLFVWGSNSHGQLGLPREHFPDNVKPLRLQVNACCVSAGLRHTAIVNSRGEVWTTGAGRHGQLGRGERLLQLDRFERVERVGSVSHVACGERHTVAWCTAECALYVWGDNKHGQLLLNTEKYSRVYTPHKIDIDVRQQVRKLLSGWSNVALWLADGSLLTWGRNCYGQLGSGSSQPAPRQLTRVSLPEKRVIADVALGSEHSVCVATDGSVWAWGWSEHGNTGAGEECALAPTRVLVPCVLSARRVFAGGAHNLLVCSSNTNTTPPPTSGASSPSIQHDDEEVAT